LFFTVIIGKIFLGWENMEAQILEILTAIRDFIWGLPLIVLVFPSLFSW